MTGQETITLTRTTTGADVPPAEFVIPRQLGSVRLLREIGRGGMGVVWLGRDDLLARDVGVKFLIDAVAGPDDPGFVRFIAGARAAAAVRHAGLTTIHHADLVAGIPYLVMEYIDGPSLSEVRKRCGPLALPAVQAVLDAVADAIGELHERGIVHQDIKPGNVLLDLDGRVFVTDFGLARAVLRHAQAAEPPTGTPTYMAPEMFAGQVSVRGDVYALAVMTYELLCGELPYRGTWDDLRDQHAHAPFPVARLRQQGVSTALVEVLERATHKDALFRYKTARHFLRAVEAACPTSEPPAAAQRRLATLAARGRDGATAPARPREDATPDSYYATLAARAAAKRGDTPLPANGSPTGAALARPEAVALGPALELDVPCIACFYNLRGQPPVGRCPECGAAVSDSLLPSRLVFADRQWRATLARGVRWTQISSILWSISMLLVQLNQAFGGPMLLTAAWPWPAALAMVFSVFMATRAEPRAAGWSCAILRWAARALLAPGLVFLQLAPFQDGDRSVAWAWTGLTLAILALIALLLFLALLAARIPDLRLARHTRLVVGVFGVLLLWLNLFFLVFVNISGPGWPLSVLMLTIALWFAPPLLFWVLLQSYARVLRRT